MNRRWKNAALTSVAAAALALAMPATSANAVNRVDCNGRMDYVNVYAWAGTLCFANHGYMDVRIEGVSNAYSGNNDLYFGISIGGPVGGGTRHLPNWTWMSNEYNDAGNTGTMSWIQAF